MSKKSLIIIISVVLFLLLAGLIGYYLIIQNGSGAPNGPSNVFRNFFPFGGQNATTTNPAGENPLATTTPSLTNYRQKLRMLSSEPVAGAGILDVKAGTLVRHIEKATGHIFETELFSPNQIRISNTTVPMVYDAVWGDKNNSLVARYLEDDNQTVDTYGISIKEVATSTESAISATKFPANLSDISSFGSKVFSLEQKTTSSAGYLSNFDGSKRVTIWVSPVKELLSQFVNSKIVALTTKPDENTAGFLFFVDTGNGSVTETLGNIPGLSTLVNDLGTQVLLLSEGSGPQMFIYDIKTKTYKNLTPATFPEKCVWSKKDRTIVYCAVPQETIGVNSLTSWYRGFVSFTDSIWKYDTKNNISNVIENLYADSNEQIDVIKPLLSENEQYLVFINKIDDSLWSLDLNQATAPNSN